MVTHEGRGRPAGQDGIGVQSYAREAHPERLYADTGSKKRELGRSQLRGGRDMRTSAVRHTRTAIPLISSRRPRMVPPVSGSGRPGLAPANLMLVADRTRGPITPLTRPVTSRMSRNSFTSQPSAARIFLKLKFVVL